MLKSFFRYIVIIILRKVTLVLRIFPIKSNRILFQAYSGKRVCGSPKCISDYLLSNYPNEYEIIWATVEPGAYKSNKQCRFVKYNSVEYFFLYATAAFFITNMGPCKIISKRKGQYIVNTWHGGGATKKDGIDRPSLNYFQKKTNIKYGQIDVDLFLTSSEAFTKFTLKGAFSYHGDIAECGLPRNDLLLSKTSYSKTKKDIFKQYGIKENSKIVLFAPTWRDYSLKDYEQIDCNRLLENLSIKFGGNWVFLYRGHNWSKESFELSDSVVNVCDYDEMQELLLIADVLITDYSSCSWDFALTDRTILLYVPDLSEYEKDFAFYLPIDEWGYPYATSNEMLFEIIKNFDQEEYLKNLHRCQKNMGICESGKATEIVCNLIQEHFERN